MKDKMNSNHFHMHQPPFASPWPPRHRYPPPHPRFLNNQTFYPPSVPQFPHPKSRFPDPLPIRQCNSSYNSRVFPEINNCHHLYPNELPCNFPPSVHNPQSTLLDSSQDNTISSNILESSQQRCLENGFSRSPDHCRTYEGNHDSHPSHRMYCHPPLHLKPEPAGDSDSLKTDKEILYSTLVKDDQSDYSNYGLPVYTAITYPEEINPHFKPDSHFYTRSEYYDESFKYAESKIEGHSCNKQDLEEKINHSKLNSNEKEDSKNLKKLMLENSSKVKNTFKNANKETKSKENFCNTKESLEKSNPKRQKFTEEKREAKYHERKGIGNHSSESKRSGNCSSKQKQSEDYNYDRRTKNLCSEQKQSRNYHREKEKSKNSNHERKGLKDQRKEKQMSGNDVADFKILKDECKKLKNVSTDSEQPRNFSRNHEKSSNSSIVEKSRNISRGKEKSRDISKQRERSRNNKEIERSRNNSKETERSRNRSKRRERSRSIIRESRNFRNPSKEWEQSISHSLKRKREKSTSTEKRKPRISSRERKRLHSHEKATTRKDVILPKRSHKYSSQVQNKGYHSSDNRSDSKLSKSHGTRHSKHDEGNGCAKTRISSAKSPETSKQNSSLNKENASTAKCTWMRSSPAELYYIRDENNHKVVIASQKLKDLHERFNTELVKRAERIKLSKPKYEPPRRKTKLRKPKPAKTENEESSSTSEESSSEEEDTSLEELERKKKHPYRLHEELWYNDPGEMNDGPLCRCSAKARRSGIRHGIYAGETSISLCDLYSNNADKLHHYHISITPITNFLSKTPTTIHHDGNDFMFEGFSILSHFEIPELPPCKVIRFNIEYTVHYVKEKFPENFTVAGLELFSHYLFTELLELVDLNWKAYDDSSGCHRFHLFPRFTRDIEANGKELLSLNVILQYLLDSNQLLIEKENLPHIMSLSKHKWQDVADKVKDMIVTCPGMKPSSIRVDQLDRELCDPKKNIYPEIVHFGVRPPQLSYAGNPNYQKAWRDYVKFRHLLANKPKVIYADRHRLLLKERRLQEMRMKNNLKRDVTVVISSEKFYKTGILCDVVQHAMLLPVLICHLRFHQSLDVLEARIGYKFKDRYLLQLALTHPSYRENFGTNPDHARNSLTNCGIRQPEYGDRRIHYMNTRKRGINTLINIMSRFGRREETTSRINHNERLEFLGDAVVEFLSSIHLFFMFSNLEEGGLATYRAAIVQNQHLAVLAKNLQLEKFMLYAHGSDLCHDLELRHAMANCFEALMGALFLDGGIDVADRVFSETLFTGIYLEEWVNYPLHPLQELEPCGDRKWIPEVHILQKLNKFEESIGIEFTHIRLLARAMTHRSLGYNNLTMGSNQRLEFLGDTVLQLVASEYLYKYFPEHHEGHLSLLRSSLVNNRTQAVVCDDLGMVEYAIYPYAKVELKAKDRADLLEAFLGALYVDKDLSYCTKFCEVCFFPRLQDFIMNQEWNDPKSKLQQCCLTLRTMDGGEPDIPVYKVIECKGPTNTRVYSVAVYFRRRRLAVGSGHSIQQAEMSAAENALGTSKDLFPQLDHQRRAIEKSLNQRKPNKREHKRK